MGIIVPSPRRGVDGVSTPPRCLPGGSWRELGPPPKEPGAAAGYYYSMKTRILKPLFLGLAAVLAAGLSTQARAEVIAISGSDGNTSRTWADIRNDGYPERAHFTEGVNLLSARLDHEIGVLKAKRAGMTTDTKDWDFSMKEVLDSREYLTSRMEELAKCTTEETWKDAKDNVGEAWKRSQLAVDKMNTTITD